MLDSNTNVSRLPSVVSLVFSCKVLCPRPPGLYSLNPKAGALVTDGANVLSVSRYSDVTKYLPRQRSHHDEIFLAIL